MVLIRIYGHKTDLLVNRKDETRSIKVGKKYNFAIIKCFYQLYTIRFIK